MILQRETFAAFCLLAVVALPGCRPKKITGIETCDEYLDTFASCLKRIPNERRNAFEQNLSRTRAIWTSMAKNPTTRPGLAQSCALARDSAKVSMQPYRCDW